MSFHDSFLGGLESILPGTGNSAEQNTTVARNDSIQLGNVAVEASDSIGASNSDVRVVDREITSTIFDASKSVLNSITDFYSDLIFNANDSQANAFNALENVNQSSLNTVSEGVNVAGQTITGGNFSTVNNNKSLMIVIGYLAASFIAYKALKK